MNTRGLFLMLLVLAASFSTAYGGDFSNNMVGEPYLQSNGPSSHMSESATIIAVKSDTVFLRTGQSAIRTIGVNATHQDGLSSVRPGDKVDLIVDRGNSILDVSESGGKGGAPGNQIIGSVQHFDALDRWIALETKGGKVQRFELRDAVATKLNGVARGQMIILEVDAKGRAIDAYRAE